MSTVWLLARASRQGRVRSWLPTLLLMAICAGVVTAAAAGARRTDTAYPRFLEASATPDLVIPYANADPINPLKERETMAAIGRLPQVAESIVAFAPLLAELVALLPGGLAARTRPALVLRTE